VSRAALLVAPLVALLVALAGCRAPALRVPLAADDPRPAALLEAWQQSTAGRRGLRGSARLAVDGAAVQVRSKQTLVVERPSRLRIEVLGLLSQTLAVLVTDGRRYELFRAQDRSFESGEVRPGLLWEVAHLDLSPEDAIDLVLGAPRIGAGLAPLRAFESGQGEIAVELGDAAGQLRERRVFDRDGRLRRLERLAAEGEGAWSARFDAYAPVAGTPLAHAIRLEMEAPATRAELELLRIELNPELPADIFQLRPAAPVGRPEGG
jgi:hypothetical protein